MKKYAKYISILLIFSGILFFMYVPLYDIKNISYLSLTKKEIAGYFAALAACGAGYVLHLWGNDSLTVKRVPSIILVVGFFILLIGAFFVELVIIKRNAAKLKLLQQRVEHLEDQTELTKFVHQQRDTVPPLKLTKITSGLTNPVFVTAPDDDSGRLFILEQSGVIRIFHHGKLNSSPYLDIRERVLGRPHDKTDMERGLLGLAFHPDYERNGRFYICYTEDPEGHLVISEYRETHTQNSQTVEFNQLILTIEQPQPKHNGGFLGFGPDDFLYIGLGDGGRDRKGSERAQDPSTLLGSILRIDVDRDDFPGEDRKNYGVPDDNPFVDAKRKRSEIYAYGFRNPWRISFDPKTGRMFAGDVGEGRWEEVNIVEKGRNYGWGVLEGRHYNGACGGCDKKQFAEPIVEYGHLRFDQSGGNSVIGGYVYRGTEMPELRGHYFLADFNSTRIWVSKKIINGKWRMKEVMKSGFPISSFGRGSDGELYVVDYTGKIYRVTKQ